MHKTRLLNALRRFSMVSAVLATSMLSVVQAKGLPGATQTSYGVSPSGAFGFQIPIITPPGRNNMQPKLSLSYSSGRGNGTMGVGWGVSGLGSITRCGRTHASDNIKGGVLHDENDRFCLNGQRLIKVSSGLYGAPGTEYRTEIDRFSKIVALGSVSNQATGSAPLSWEVWHKDGRIEEYGSTSAARFALAASGNIHAWRLNKVSNRQGNFYSVTYTRTQRIPNAVYINGGIKVQFNYLDRDDVRSSYVLGQRIDRIKRLASITVTKDTDTIRHYDLAYDYAGLTERSRLSSVTECGLNGECLPPIDIQWNNDTAGLSSTSVAGYKAKEASFSFDTSSDNLNREITKGAWADVNGDGKVDQIIAYRGPTGSAVLHTYLQIEDSNGDPDWELDSDYALPHVLRDYSRSITDSNLLTAKVINQGQLLDVNGDGLVDIVYAVQYQHQANTTTTLQETWINKGNNTNPNDRKGWAKDSNLNLPDFIYSYLDNSTQVTDPSTGQQYTSFIETRRGRFVDINGDGLVDWLRAYHVWNGSNHINTWINTGTSWLHTPTYNMPDVFAEYRGAHSLRHGELLDLNGDGLLDWVQSYHANTASAQIDAWLNTGSGFDDAPSAFHLPDMLYENVSGWDSPRARGSFVDVNGDGLRDFVLDSEGGPNGNGYTKTRKTWLNQGNGWAYRSEFNAPFIHKDHRYIGHTGQQGNQGGANWPLNTNGFYIDMNRDGLVDFAQSYKDVHGVVQEQTWINNGLGWDEDASFNTGQLFYDYSGQSIAKVRYGDFLDINSDGSPDWVKSRHGESLVTQLGQTARADQLKEITTTLGYQVRPTFAPLTANTDLYQKGVGESEEDARHVIGPIYVTSELNVSANNGSGFNRSTYHYSGAQAHRKGRGFLGFKSFKTSNDATGLSQTRIFRQDYPFTGSVAETTVSEISNGTVWLSKTVNDYDSTTTNGGATTFVYLDSSVSQKAELEVNGGGEYQWARTTHVYQTGDYGRLQRTTTEVGLSASEVQHSTSVTNNYHSADIPNWLIAQIADTSTTTSEPGVANSTLNRKDAYTYYPTSGALHTKIREPDTSDDTIKLITTYTYDAFGNVEEERLDSTGSNAETRINTLSFVGAVSSRRLPTSMTNALGQTSTISYHPQCDQPETVTGIDGLVSTYSYDNFCRQTSVTDASGVSEVTEYHYTGSPNGFPTSQCGPGGCSVIPRFSVTTDLQGQPAVTRFFNLVAQPFLSVTEGMSVGQVIKQETEYDTLGRVSRQSQPYFEGQSEYWSENHYDALNRLTRTDLPFTNDEGFTAKIHHSFGVDANQRQKNTTLNARGHYKETYANALGQIVEVKNDSQHSLRYDYDSQGNLIKTTDAGNNDILVGYDTLGRRTSLNDPDLGQVIYGFDAFGQQTSQTDAKGQKLVMRYDALSRLKERDVPISSDPGPVETTYFNYDDANVNAIGKLNSVIKGSTGSQQNATHYGYDQYGRLDAKVVYIKGQRFEEALTYNTDGQLSTRGYPASGVDGNNDPIHFAVQYNYQNGYLQSISGLDSNGVACIQHWRADEYDALGRATIDTLGTIVTTTRTFDPAQGVLREIDSMVTVGTAGMVQDLSYDYDVNNNLKSRNDGITLVNETFEYDNLDRLRFHHQGSDTVEVRYDNLGNITHKSDVGDYDYVGQGGPHAVSIVNSPLGSYNPLAKFTVDWEWDGETITNQAQAMVTDSQYQYDANGNITQQGNRHLTWTAFDKPASMTHTGTDGIQRGSLIEYDGELNRHYKIEGVFNAAGNLQTTKETTYYVGKEYEKIEKENGEITHRYTINTGGGIVQIERDHNTGKDRPKYLLTDNLGSTNVILNAMGEVEQRLSFDPWGMRTNVGDTTAVNDITNRGYTGHEMDDEVGLINMNARIYDPYLGRFLSADPVLPDAGDMQQFNRYSYVTNNPMKFIDPTGNTLEEIVVEGQRPSPGGGIGFHDESLFSGGESGYSGGSIRSPREILEETSEEFNNFKNEFEAVESEFLDVVADLLTQARASDGVITLTTGQLATVVKYTVYQFKNYELANGKIIGQSVSVKALTLLGLGIGNRPRADGIFRDAELKDRTFNLDGKQYRGSDINYYVVGALAAAQGISKDAFYDITKFYNGLESIVSFGEESERQTRQTDKVQRFVDLGYEQFFSISERYRELQNLADQVRRGSEASDHYEGEANGRRDG